MRENHFFVRSTSLAGCVAALAGGRPAVLSYPLLARRVARLAGADAVSLFAEPVLPLGTDADTVSWYSAHEGAVVEFDALDEAARRPAAERFALRLRALTPALEDPEIGRALSTWLNVVSADQMLLIGGEPVLTGWGYVPGSIAGSAELRQEHFARTLSRFVPSLAVPPLEAPLEDEGAGRNEVRSVNPLGGMAMPIAQPAGGGAGEGKTGNKPGRPWIAPLLAVLAALAVLLILLIPGVLVYPAAQGRSIANDIEAQRLRSSSDSLEAQLKALQAEARNRTCRPGNLTVPVPDTQWNDQPSSPAGQTQSQPREPLRMEALPRPPERLPVPPQPGEQDRPVSTVAQLLDDATVLIIAAKPPEGLSEGSGFFIGPRHVVTNHHVVAGVNDRHLFVASKALGGVKRARVIAKSSPPPSEGDLHADIAVLEIESGSNHTSLKLGTTPPKLSTAYVAGFPGFVTQRDNNFQNVLQKMVARSRGEDAQANGREVANVPSADLKYGRINNSMRSGSQSLEILIHDMQLAPGNSGGPLVDACGRLGGINTMLFMSGEGRHQANVAQDVSILRAFLTAKGIAFDADDTPCRPPAVTAEAAPPAPSQNPPPSPQPVPANREPGSTPEHR